MEEEKTIVEIKSNQLLRISDDIKQARMEFRERWSISIQWTRIENYKKAVFNVNYFLVN